MVSYAQIMGFSLILIISALCFFFYQKWKWQWVMALGLIGGFEEVRGNWSHVN